MHVSTFNGMTLTALAKLRQRYHVMFHTELRSERIEILRRNIFDTDRNFASTKVLGSNILSIENAGSKVKSKQCIAV